MTFAYLTEPPRLALGNDRNGCAMTRRRFPVSGRPTRRFAPAGSNRSRHGGDEMSEASTLCLNDYLTQSNHNLLKSLRSRSDP